VVAVANNRPGWMQVGVLRLEPTRSAATVGCIVVAILAVVVAAAALLYRTDSWPEAWRPEPVAHRAPLILAGVAGFVALLFLIGAAVNVRRWRTSRTVERMSEDPALLAFLPDTAASPPMPRAAVVPPLEVRFVKPGKLPKVRGQAAEGLGRAQRDRAAAAADRVLATVREPASDPDVRRRRMARVRVHLLAAQLQEAWSLMADGSPNAVASPKQAVVAATDYLYADGELGDGRASSLR
jgi:hypothetical protein